MNEIGLVLSFCIFMWCSMGAVAMLIAANTNKRLGYNVMPKDERTGFEYKYLTQEVNDRYEAQREMEHWNRWGLGFNGETLTHFNASEFDCDRG